MRIHAGEVAGPPRLGRETFPSAIGAVRLEKLRDRLTTLNADIATKGRLQFHGAKETLLLGCAYDEFYDQAVDS